MSENQQNRVPEYFAKANGSAAAISTSELKAEIEKRSTEVVFPLDVFHPLAQDRMTAQHTQLDIPRSYVGTSMLAAYSAAIGNAYVVRSKTGSTPVSLWVCLIGISSSGKTMCLNQNLFPLQDIQTEFDKEWPNETFLPSSDPAQPMKTVLFRDAVVATLARTIMPDNPKGVSKLADEILEFINGLNQYSQREGTDEQFWLSGWNGTTYSGIRAGRVKYTIPRMFANVFGGIQPSVVWKLFQKDRATTGFIFRMLFARCEPRIAQPDSTYSMPQEMHDIHAQCIKRMYQELPVNDAYAKPKDLILSHEATVLRDGWRKDRILKINRMTDPMEKEVHSGILGKIYDYAGRFCGLLAVADLSYDKRPFPDSFTMDANLMERALRLADYFYHSAWQTYCNANKTVVAPMEVLRFAGYVRANYSMQRIGDIEYPQTPKPDARRKRASRELKKMLNSYPKVFGAVEKS
jgi:hypothetical protein